jgi:hypothetical protein
MDDMHLLIDDQTAERLVCGTVAPDDAPPGYARLASLVRDAQAPGLPNELVGGGAVASMAAAIVSNTLTPAPSRAGTAPGFKRINMFSKIVTAKAAALAVAALFGLGTAAAAATGALQGSGGSTHPTVAMEITNASSQGTTSQPAGGPATSGGASGGSTAGATTTSSSGSSTINAPLTGPANQHALFGLCTAFLAGSGSTGAGGEGDASLAPTGGTATTTGTGTSPGGKYNSTAFRALINEAGGSVASTASACTSFLQNSSGTSSAATSDGTPSGSSPTDAGTGRPASPGRSGSHSHGHGHSASASHGHAR